jgi:signal transduction histidine kinase
VLDNVLDLCRLRIEQKSLTVVREGDDVELFVSLDIELMEQALQGLIVNAIEASPEHGNLTMRVASSGDRVNICVSDDGPGMPFAPATTDLAPGPTTKRFGTGLGIPFALRVIEEHGGTIEFKPRQPHGTEVIVVIPTHQAGEKSADVNE